MSCNEGDPTILRASTNSSEGRYLIISRHGTIQLETRAEIKSAFAARI
jgi:hypothetical protein